MDDRVKEITDLILNAREESRKEIKNIQPEFSQRVKWPITCTVGPGLEGAIACESAVGYVNGSQGSLIYRGYDVFDLCAYSTYEEVSYLLLHGHLPTAGQLKRFNKKMVEFRYIPNTLRRFMGSPIDQMMPMAALRLGADYLRFRLTWRDSEFARPSPKDGLAADEDSIPMEKSPTGEEHAIYEIPHEKLVARPRGEKKKDDALSIDSCIHLISGIATIAAAVMRLRDEKMPVEPDAELSHAANLLYMMTGKKPTPVEERIMDVALILHADHGMNASTFAAMVVASTMADIYLSVGSGISALSGALHGGANELVIKVIKEVDKEGDVGAWYDRQRAKKHKIPGFGHRVYKTYDPRARILGPLAKYLAKTTKKNSSLIRTAEKLEKIVVADLGKKKNIFPNVDFYSGLVYDCMGIPESMFTPLFAVSRVAGWTARVSEYLKKNRIFRPRSTYIGEFYKEYTPLDQR